MAGTPLMELEESWMYGMFPTRLLIFEDRIEVRDFELLRERTESRGYDRVERVVVSGEGRLANLVITEKDKEPVLIRGLDRDAAGRAGALIEERVASARTASPSPPATAEEERLIQSLTDLRNAGVLSEEEFEAKRRGVTGRGETRGGP